MPFAFIVGHGVGVLRPAEDRHVVGTLDDVGDHRGQPDSADRGEVSGATQFPQHHRLVVRGGCRILGDGFGLPTGEQVETGIVRGVDHRRGGVHVGLESRQPFEQRSGVRVGAGDVLPSRLPRVESLLGARPQFVDQSGVEVPERRVNDGGVHIAEHTAPTQEVETKSIETEFLPSGDSVGMEDEGLGESAGLQRDGLGGVSSIHRTDHLRSEVMSPSHRAGGAARPRADRCCPRPSPSWCAGARGRGR